MRSKPYIDDAPDPEPDWDAMYAEALKTHGLSQEPPTPERMAEMWARAGRCAGMARKAIAYARQVERDAQNMAKLYQGFFIQLEKE